MEEQKFKAELVDDCYWVVVHIATNRVVATGLSQEQAEEIAAAMREGLPTDL